MPEPAICVRIGLSSDISIISVDPCVYLTSSTALLTPKMHFILSFSCSAFSYACIYLLSQLWSQLFKVQGAHFQLITKDRQWRQLKAFPWEVISNGTKLKSEWDQMFRKKYSVCWVCSMFANLFTALFCNGLMPMFSFTQGAIKFHYCSLKAKHVSSTHSAYCVCGWITNLSVIYLKFAEQGGINALEAIW